MTFKKAVESTTDVKDSYRPGLQALPAHDRSHVASEDPSRLTGSLYLDEALREMYPASPRWDYAVGHRPSNRKGEMVYWIEVHPANSGQVKVVLAKLRMLREWLNYSAPRLRKMHREFIWVSSGKTAFTASAPQQKEWALLGLQHKGRHFIIPNEAVI